MVTVVHNTGCTVEKNKSGVQQTCLSLRLSISAPVPAPPVVVVCSVVADSLQTHGLQPTRLFCSWDFPGKYTEVGCHFLLQEIFPTQGSNPQPLHLLIWHRFFITASPWKLPPHQWDP